MTEIDPPVKFVDIRFIVEKNVDVKLGSIVNNITVTEKNIDKFAMLKCSAFVSKDDKAQLKFFVEYANEPKTVYRFALAYDAKLYCNSGLMYFNFKPKDPPSRKLDTQYEYDKSVGKFNMCLSHDSTGPKPNIDQSEHLVRLYKIMYEAILDLCKEYLEKKGYGGVDFVASATDEIKVLVYTILSKNTIVNAASLDDLHFILTLPMCTVSKDSSSGKVVLKYKGKSFEDKKTLILFCFPNFKRSHYRQSYFVTQSEDGKIQTPMGLEYLVNKSFKVYPSFGISTYEYNGGLRVGFVSCVSIVSEMPTISEREDAIRPSPKEYLD